MKRPNPRKGGQRDSGDARYRMLVDSIADYAIYMLDEGGRVSSWNTGAQRLKGYSPSEIIGQHFSKFYTPEDLARGLPATALKTAATENRFEQEGWRVRKDGTRFWASVVIDPIRREDGALVGYAKITRDLTERKRTEETLRRSEEELRLLIQGVTDYAIYRLDLQGYVTSWNAGAQRIKGYRPEEIIGKHFSQFYADDDRVAGVPEAGLALAAREGRSEKEGWRVRKDGTQFWAHVIIDAIRNEDGEVIGFAKVTRDVTERMEAQKALERSREALFQSRKMEAIGQLTGGVAHDFNNLLMVVLSSLDLVRRRMPPDPVLSPLIENAIHGAERGAALTKRMLAFARKQELKLEAVEVPAMVGSMLGLMQRSLGPSISIKLDFAPRLAAAVTDANQLENAMLNLVINARDAMPDGGTITISADAAAVSDSAPGGLEAGDYVRLGIADTGQGMDEETLAHAGEPFFTTKGVGKGTGLGLAMVQGLAAQSGGRLTLKSVKGQGTTAELWLRASPTERSPDAPAAARVEAATRPLRVLAVDDDVLVLFNTVAMLEDLGHQVCEATSGHEALARVKSGEPLDLVITDQAMPEMTGMQLASAIRQEHPELAILLATGYADLPLGGRQTDLPRLAKPFLQHELAQAIADVAAWRA
jgi:PAS domain S-box-containing protein